MNNFVGDNNSEWRNEIDDNLPIVSEWKCPYHNGRMCLELIKRNVIKPCNDNLDIEARKLLNYFGSIENKKIISGQHTQTIPKEEIEHIYTLTNKKPLLVGYELLSYSPNINPLSDDICLKEVNENKNTLSLALNEDGITELTWHWFSPLYGKGKAFYSEYTEFDPLKIFIDSEEKTAFYKDLDHMASILSKFKKPVIWRPFHEAEGAWFWWGKRGPEITKKLYILMYDYFVNKYKLNNLIWAWSAPVGYPGDNYVDILGWDIYTDKHRKTAYIKEYNELLKSTNNKLLAITECGIIPDINLLKENNIPWIYFMTWSKEFILTDEYNYNDKIKEIYNSKYTITKCS